LSLALGSSSDIRDLLPLAPATSHLVITENNPYRLLLLVRDQVPVSSNHFFRLMPDPGIDHPLVDPHRRTV